MESKTINTIEINGKAIDLSKKMVEIPRRKKFFETSKAYSEYLEEVLKEAFPYNEKLHSIEDYDYFIDYNVYKLWEAADETKETLGKKVSKKIAKVKEKFSKNKEEEEVVEEKEEKKETLLTKLLKPIKSIGKVIFLPFTLVFRLVKTIGKKIRKGFKWINSKMPWSKKNKKEDDLEKMLEDAIENENDNDIADEMLKQAEEELEKEAQEELSKGVNEELAKANEEKTKELIEKLRAQVEELEKENKKITESLNARVEELNKENQTLKNRVEIYKKQPERDKVWEKYFAEQKEKEEAKEKTKEVIATAEKEMNDNRFKAYKPSIVLTEVNKENIKKACQTPYTITKGKDSIRVYKKGIKEYQDSQKLSETENTITITGTLYENLLYSEYELNVHMRDMAVNVYKVPFYKVDYNYNGLIKKNKEKIGGKIVNASVVLTKERYEELVENATKYFNLMGDVSYYSSNELENNNQKKLVK